jgi:hypothetical protein
LSPSGPCTISSIIPNRSPPIADAQAGKALLRRLGQQGDGDGNRFRDRVDSALAALSAAAPDGN